MKSIPQVRSLKAGMRILFVIVLAQLVSMPASHAQLYKEAPPELNKRAEQALRSLFAARSDKGTRQLFGGKFMICGPFLWRAMQNAKELESVAPTKTMFFSPKTTSKGTLGLEDHGNGRTFNSAKDLDAFRRAFLARHPADAKSTIRKLRMSEVQLLLMTMPFPAEEPLFVIESKKHRFIVNMDKDLRVFWIDDYLHLR